VATRYVNMGLRLFASFFLTAIILRSLGKEAYGFFSVINSVTGYLGVADLGARTAITKFSGEFKAQDDQEAIGRFVSTCLLYYSVIALACLGAGAWRCGVWNVFSR